MFVLSSYATKSSLALVVPWLSWLLVVSCGAGLLWHFLCAWICFRDQVCVVVFVVVSRLSASLVVLACRDDPSIYLGRQP